MGVLLCFNIAFFLVEKSSLLSLCKSCWSFIRVLCYTPFFHNQPRAASFSGPFKRKKVICFEIFTWYFKALIDCSLIFVLLVPSKTGTKGRHSKCALLPLSHFSFLPFVESVVAPTAKWVSIHKSIWKGYTGSEPLLLRCPFSKQFTLVSNVKINFHCKKWAQFAKWKFYSAILKADHI